MRRILLNLGKIGRDQLNLMSKVEQDRELLRLRRELEEGGAKDIDFFVPTLKQVWDPTAPEEEQAALETVAAPPDAFTAESALPLNLILYGLPGTGKTYRTVDRALQVIDPDFAAGNKGDRPALKSRFDELVGNGSIQFVTFHQSFSYEDFVGPSFLEDLCGTAM